MKTKFTRIAMVVSAAAAVLGSSLPARAGQFSQEFTTGLTALQTNFGDGSILMGNHLGTVSGMNADTAAGSLLLTLRTTNSTRAAYLLPDLDPGTPVFAFSLKFNLTIYGEFPNAGEGFSVNFGQLRGLNLGGAAYAQESGFDTGLSFCAQTANGNSPGFYLRAYGNVLASKAYDAATQWGVLNTTPHFCEIDFHYMDGVTVRIDHQVIFDKVRIRGYFVPQAGDSLALAARTGTSPEMVRIDDVKVMTKGNLAQLSVAHPYYQSPGSRSAPAAFDNDNATDWDLPDGTNGYVGGTISGGAQAVRAFCVGRSTWGLDFRDPKAFNLESSDNGGASWAIQGSVPLRHWDSRPETRCWLVADTGPHTAYRLNITKEWEQYDGWGPEVGELRLFKFIPFEPVAPTFTNTTATVMGRRADLTTTVTSSGLNTVLRIDWGTTASYGFATIFSLPPNLTTNVTLTLSNLAPMTTYHFRVTTGNPVGANVSPDLTFTTDGTAPVATTLAPTNVSTWSAELVGMASPVSVPTIAWFETGSTANYGHRSTATPVPGGAASSHIIQAASFAASTTFHYRFVVSNEFGMTLGSNQSFTTLGDLSVLDVLTKDSPVIGTSANSPAGEEAPLATDDTAATKYSNFDKLNAGIIVRSAGARVVRALSLISAQNLPERDPASFLLEGSLDGTNFTAIASNAVPPFAGRSAIQTIAFSNTTAFTIYRLRFPTVANPAAANMMQIGEVELLAYPEISSGNDAVNVTASGAFWTPGQTLCNRRLDGLDKFAVENNTANVIVDITPAAGPTVLSGFELVGGNDSDPQRHPISVAVLGSHDGTNFVELGSFVPPRPTADLQIQEFLVRSNTTAFAHYRFSFGPQQSDIWWQLGEIRLFGQTAPEAPLLSIGAVGTNVVVSWPSAAGFNLETKASLAATWAPVGIPPVLSSGVSTITIPMSATNGFFRLKK